jgi:hypothetical protein
MKPGDDNLRTVSKLLARIGSANRSRRQIRSLATIKQTAGSARSCATTEPEAEKAIRRQRISLPKVEAGKRPRPRKPPISRHTPQPRSEVLSSFYPVGALILTLSAPRKANKRVLDATPFADG